jgi:hypothetical protein
MTDPDWKDRFGSWCAAEFAHPDSPAGGAGTGFSRPPGSAQEPPFSPVPCVGSPAGRCFDWAGEWARGGLADAGEPIKEEESDKSKKPQNVENLNNRRDFCFSTAESAAFDALLQTAMQLGVGVARDPDPDADTLASYDLIDNVIWIPAPEFQRASHNDEFKTTMAHELAHAVQNSDLLKQASGSEMRKQLVAKRAREMSEDDFVKFMWNREVEAERTAWNIYNETISSFSKRKGDGEFRAPVLKDITDFRVGEFTSQKRAGYEKAFRDAYRKLTTAKTK